MTKKAALFSGRVLKVPPTEVSTNRYKWIKLEETEPDLGVPTVDGALIFSDQQGTRNWTTNLKTDALGNLETQGVAIVANSITSKLPGSTLELGTADGLSGNVVVNANLTVNGTINFQGGISEINLGAGQAILIGGEEVLSQVTLGPTVINSSLTSVGIIETGVWQGSPIQTEYGGTGRAGVTQNAVLIGDGTNPMKETKGDPFQVLQVDATGTPTFAGLDYGNF